MINLLSFSLALVMAAHTITTPDQTDGAPRGPSIEAVLQPVAIERLFTHWSSYSALPEDERTGFTLRYKAAGPENWNIWLERANGQLDHLAGYPEPYIIPPAFEHFERNARLHIETRQAGGLSITMQMIPNVELSEDYQANILLTALNQANRAIRSFKGVAALFAPRIDEVIFRFEDTAPDAVAVMADGSRRDLPVEGALVSFNPTDRLFRQTVALEFGRAPDDVTLNPG